MKHTDELLRARHEYAKKLMNERFESRQWKNVSLFSLIWFVVALANKLFWKGAWFNVACPLVIWFLCTQVVAINAFRLAKKNVGKDDCSEK